MTDYGVTPSGFVRKPLSVILSEVRASQIGGIASDLDVSDETPLGQINGILGDAAEACWELGEDVFNSDDPDSAEDAALDNVCSLTGTYRRSAGFAYVNGRVNLDAGKTLSLGAVAHISDHPEERFLTTFNVTNSSGAAAWVNVQFKSESPSTRTVGIGQLSTIAEAQTGWNQVDNASEGTPGIVQDSNPTLRARRVEELDGLGGSTIAAITADLLRAFPNELRTCNGYENDGDTIDANGLPPHSVEMLIDDGGVLSNNDVAQVIWKSRGGGIQTYGNTSGTAIDSNGVSRTVAFSRPVEKDVWIEVDVDDSPTTYAGDTAVKDAILAEGASKLRSGVDVVALVYRSAPLVVAGVNDVTAIRLGFSASPSGTANLTIGVREIAQLDASRILVNT